MPDPHPTTEYASVVLGVWQYGKAKGFAEKGQQEERTADQWRDVARRRCLGLRSADFRPFEGAWQYRLGHDGSHFVGGCLGMVQRYDTDGSLYRSPSLVDGRDGTSRAGNLPGLAQRAGHLDRVLVAAVVGASASADGRTGGQALARRPLVGAGCGWLARQRAPHPGEREGFLCPRFRQQPHGPAAPEEERQARSSQGQTGAAGQAADLGHVALAYGLANA